MEFYWIRGLSLLTLRDKMFAICCIFLKIAWSVSLLTNPLFITKQKYQLLFSDDLQMRKFSDLSIVIDSKRAFH